MKTKPIFSRLSAVAARGTAPALALLAIVLATTNIACTPAVETNNPPAKQSTADSAADEPRASARATADEKPSSEVPSAADCERIARLFGEALLAGNYPAAYQLTSARLHGRMSQDKFAQACKQAAKQYGEAIQLGKVVIDRRSGLAGSAASEQYGFPADIPDHDRLAWLHCALALDVDGEEILRCYDCWMLMENDGGKAHIGHFSFIGCQ
jgi:hypothetical protein